ncbi:MULTISPECIES: FecR domain-containing protein [unclassified Methylophaga]|uniref:FecR domain-containing protein n=1 Tax=unclassified Methylophaga TaxID=2629249 RepID=UPI000C93EC44|nr:MULTISPECIES: FecR domain-containing protein [unclassified Methylophaga]MBN47518.1 iron dicitrate transport regulator FecR [Methylophaga sp.]|tara:strand:+ start:42620 stop:43591 length:972 start_codon:yes stop_codon:yes gene_type:complete
MKSAGAKLTPQQQKALADAAQWHVELTAGSTSHKTKDWQSWLAKQPENHWAWQQLEKLQNQLKQLPGELAFKSLKPDTEAPPAKARRNVLKSLAGIGVISSSSWLAWQYSPAGLMLADHFTHTGQIREVKLADGSTVILNSASAINVDFSPVERRINLQQGEIMISTSPNHDIRPFYVQTRQGLLKPLGTRFSVQQQQDKTVLSVFEHQVKVSLPDKQQIICPAGQKLAFTNKQFETLTTIVDGEDAWLQQKLIINDMPLSEFLAELARYRPGVIRVEPELAKYHISGTFDLTNTDQALIAVSRLFPVDVTFRSRYWVSVHPA